jgi:hypothetical protein
MAENFHYEKLCLLNDIYHHSFTEADDSYEISPLIKTSLYPHQKTMVQKMIQHRERMTYGFMVDQCAINGKVGIVGDSHGSGKTLCVLAYLAASLSITLPRMTNELSDHSTKYFFSHDLHQVPTNNVSNLIIVPHHLYHQWKEEIEKHTTMTYVPIETKRMIKENDTIQKINSSLFVLTTSKCYRYVQDYARRQGIHWNHIFVDEPSTIYVNPSDPPLSFQFLWFMTNNWLPLLFKNPTIHSLQLYAFKDRIHLHPDLSTWLLDKKHEYYDSLPIVSTFIKDYLPFYHPYRSKLILRNADHWIEQSMKVPAYSQTLIQCKPNLTINSLTSFFLARNIQPNFGSSHIPYLFQALGVDFSVIEKYKESQPTTKHALIQRKMDENECVICFDRCEFPTIVSCCQHLYCAKCILRNIIMNPPKCPTCREPILISSMTCIHTLSMDQQMIGKSKMEICLDLFRKNPHGKFMIYSSFENIYYQLFEEIDRMGMKAERIENNLFSLTKTLRNFKQGSTNIIFISDVNAIRGLTFSSISHLIFYHELASSELKEVLIHSAHRVKRSDPLSILYLNSEIQV